MLRGYTQEQAEKILNERANESKRNYSIESINFFKRHFDADGWYFGEKEWFIYDKITKRHYFYDFTNIKKRIIVEYHGERFHPNPKVLTNEEMTNWFHLFSKATAAEVIQKDRYKKCLSEQQSFRYFEIYSNDSQEYIDTTINQIKELLYENNS